jgi:hypothetical protein
MDPGLFHVDWEQLFEVLAAVVVLAFVVERGLALLFEHRWYVSRFDKKGFKEPIAFLVALLICWYWDFDLVSVLLTNDKVRFVGEILTAAVVAGGSKASIKLFHDLMDVRSSAAKAAKTAESGG